MLLLALLCGLTGARAVEVTVGNLNVEAVADCLPMRSLSHYSYSQQIYTAEEIGMEGTINSITLWLAGGPGCEVSFDIYMVETDKAKFSNKDWVPLTVDNLVYSGSATFSNTTVQPYTFELDLPFEYYNEGNLLIAFNSNTVTLFEDLLGVTFDSEFKRSMYHYDSRAYDVSNPPNMGYEHYVRNVVKFDISPDNGLRPETLEATDLLYDQATLIWTGGTGRYNVEYRKKDATSWTKATNTAISATTLTLNALSENTEYVARVRSVSNGTVSMWRYVTFTTPYRYPAPTDLHLTFITANMVTLNWTENGDAETWIVEYWDELYPDYKFTQGSVSTTSFITGLTEDHTYSARVQAIEGSQWSETISFVPTNKVVIGSGTDTNYYIPTNSWSKYSLTYQLFTAEELGGEAPIQSIDFYNTNSWIQRELDIYMVNTSRSNFAQSGIFTYILDGVSDDDLVFSGYVYFSKDRWTTIQLQKPFDYSGEGMILVINDKTGSSSSNNGRFLCFTTNLHGQAATFSGSTQYDPTISRTCYNSNPMSSVKNQIRILKGPAPALPRPKNLLADAAPTYTNLSWESDATGFDVSLGTVTIPEYSWLRYEDKESYTNSEVSVRTTSKVEGDVEEQTWGVMYPGRMVTGQKLTKVNIMENFSYTRNIMTLKIYAGGDYEPGTLLHTQTVDPRYKSGDTWHEVTLTTPVNITPGQNLWITLTETGTYVMLECELAEAEPNSQWVCVDGTWMSYTQYRNSKGYYDDQDPLLCWLIWGCMEELTNTVVEWANPVSTTAKQYTLRDLQPETTYKARVRAKDSQGNTSGWTTTTFTTLSALAVPKLTDITDITRTSATANWKGYQTFYNVKLTSPRQPKKSAFKKVGSSITSEELQQYTFNLSQYSGVGTIAFRHTGGGIVYVDDIRLTYYDGDEALYENFEGGSIPSGWINMTCYGGKSPWSTWETTPPKSRASAKGDAEDSYCNGNCCAWSGYYSSGDNWLIIPNVELGGTLTIYARCSNDEIEVCARSKTPAQGSVISNPAVLGVYVTTENNYIMEESSTTKTNVYGSWATFYNLEPGAYYSVVVQGTENGQTTDWSLSRSFKTNEFELGDVNADGNVTPADAIMILYRYFGVEQTGFHEEVADLNSDGSITPADAIETLYRYFGTSGNAREKAPATEDAFDPE